MAKLQIKDKNGNFIELDENNIGSIFTVEAKNVPINLNQNEAKRFSLNVSKEGYTPIGVVGYYAKGTNMTDVIVTTLSIVGSNVEIVLKNTSTGIISKAEEILDILYKAN